MRRYAAALVLVLAGCASAPREVASPEERPNVLVIVADDLGPTDPGFLGGEIRTPHLDALAASGIVLTRFLVSPACSPTRAMLLSGTESHVAGLGTMAGEAGPRQEGRPGYEGHLSHRVTTVAQTLRDAGYRTCMAGKWHLGGGDDLLPHRRGFERSFALVPGGASHFSDATALVEAGGIAPYLEDGRPTRLPEGFFSTDHFTDRLIEYIGDGREARPFFAYAAYTAPHWPLQAPDDRIDDYAGRYDAGWDDLRARRLAGARRAGLVPPGAAAPSRFAFVRPWEVLSADERRIETRKMEIYAAMVEHLDAGIGRLVDHLRSIGELDRTLILFFSDNGPEGNRIRQLENNAEWIPRRFDNSLANMGRVNSYVDLGAGWAQATGAPFRLFKTFPTAGGVRVPAIVRWGERRKGSRHDAMVTVKDVAPTVLELARAAHPLRGEDGRRVAPMTGRSFAPFLRGLREEIHEEAGTMVWELFGRRAVQHGRWKALWIWAPYGPGRWELFDVEADPGEQVDLAARHPDRLAELVRAWQTYAARHGVVLPASDTSYAKP